MKNDTKTALEKMLSLQARCFVLILEVPPTLKGSTYVEFVDKALDNIKRFRYWLILHTEDFNEQGERKRPHLHLVLDYGSNCRLERVLNLLDTVIGYPSFIIKDGEWIINPAISIDLCHNRLGAIRYLMHLDDDDKAKYPPTSVFTNSADELKRAINASAFGVTPEWLTEVCILTNCNRIDIIKELGLELYSKYRLIIGDIIYALKN